MHKTLFQKYASLMHVFSFPTWLSDSFEIASCVIDSVFQLMKSSMNAVLWYLHPCPVELIGDVTHCCLLIFSSLISGFLSCAIVILLDFPILWMFLSAPVVSFFVKTFQIAVWAMPNVFAIPRINFPSFLRLKMTTDVYGRKAVFMLIYLSFFYQIQSSQVKPGATKIYWG